MNAKTDDVSGAVAAPVERPVRRQPIPPGVRAHSDTFNHVLVRMSDGREYGMDLVFAMRLLRDLKAAVDIAAGVD